MRVNIKFKLDNKMRFETFEVETPTQESSREKAIREKYKVGKIQIVRYRQVDEFKEEGE